MKEIKTKRYILKTLAISLLFCTPVFSQKIPITSKSEQAIEVYKQGLELENILKLDAAKLAYKKAIEIDSTFALAHFRLGMVRDNYDFRKQKLKDALLYIDDISEGERLLIKARVDFYAEGYDGSKEYSYFKALVLLYPKDEVANYLFGFVNLHHGGNNSDKAIKHYKNAIEINPNYLAPYNELAYAYMATSNYKEAKQIAQEYVKRLPGSVNPLDTYAEIFMRSGDYQESINNYEKVLALSPDFPWALMGIAANLNFLDKHKEARFVLEKIDESKLSDYEYRHKWRSKVVSFLDEGDIENAINTLELQKQESLSGKNKREPLFHIYYAFLRKTRLYFENNQSKLGMIEYNKWNTYVQGNMESENTKKRVSNLKNFYIAYEAFYKKKYKEALNYLDVYEIQTITDESILLRAKLYSAKGNFEKAIILLRKTEASNPYNQYWLAVNLLKMGKIEEAKTLQNEILNFNERNNINLALARNKIKR